MRWITDLPNQCAGSRPASAPRGWLMRLLMSINNNWVTLSEPPCLRSFIHKPTAQEHTYTGWMSSDSGRHLCAQSIDKRFLSYPSEAVDSWKDCITPWLLTHKGAFITDIMKPYTVGVMLICDSPAISIISFIFLGVSSLRHSLILFCEVKREFLPGWNFFIELFLLIQDVLADHMVLQF